MKIFLFFTGLSSIILSALSLFSPDVIKRFSDFCNKIVLDIDAVIRKLSDFCNRIVLDVDAKMHHARKVSGVIFLIAGIVIWYAALKK